MNGSGSTFVFDGSLISQICRIILLIHAVRFSVFLRLTPVKKLVQFALNS